MPHPLVLISKRRPPGAHQQEVDSLVLSTLFPRGIADKLLKDLSANRRLLLCGATGIGKNYLNFEFAPNIFHCAVLMKKISDF